MTTIESQAWQHGEPTARRTASERGFVAATGAGRHPAGDGERPVTVRKGAHLLAQPYSPAPDESHRHGLTDEWKPLWLAHVRKRASSGNSGDQS